MMCRQCSQGGPHDDTNMTPWGCSTSAGGGGKNKTLNNPVVCANALTNAQNPARTEKHLLGVYKRQPDQD